MANQTTDTLQQTATQGAAAAGAAGGAAILGPTGGIIGGQVGQVAGAVGGKAATDSSDKCCSCCGSKGKADAQKAAIAQQLPLTGNASVDPGIIAKRDAEFDKWQKANDIAMYENLSDGGKAQVVFAKSFADQLMAQLPVADQNLTLAEAYAKYPDLANQVFDRVKAVTPSLAGMPIEFAMGLAKASGVDQLKISDIKSRFDYVLANAPSAKAIAANPTDSGGSSLAMGGGALALAALAAVWVIKKVRG
jgi:hypothetical protein